MAYRFNEQIKHGEDLLLFLSIAHSGTYKAIEKVVYDYRYRPDSAMRDLPGLEAGYQALEDELRKWKNVNEDQLKPFRKKWRSIMVKSYLKTGKIADALRLRTS